RWPGRPLGGVLPAALLAVVRAARCRRGAWRSLEARVDVTPAVLAGPGGLTLRVAHAGDQRRLPHARPRHRLPGPVRSALPDPGGASRVGERGRANQCWTTGALRRSLWGRARRGARAGDQRRVPHARPRHRLPGAVRAAPPDPGGASRVVERGRANEAGATAALGRALVGRAGSAEGQCDVEVAVRACVLW